MNLKLPKETLMKLGFRLLDIIYGELTMKKGRFWDEVFVDKDGESRFAYNVKFKFLGCLIKDSKFFLDIIPVSTNDYERVLRAWFEDRYNLTINNISPYSTRSWQTI